MDFDRHIVDFNNYGSENIEVVNKYKYLGIILSNKGSFKLAVEDLLVKAKKAYAAIYQSLNIYNGAKPKIILKAIGMMVFPILTYGCEVWAPFIYKHSLDDLLRNVRDKMEKFHIRICKNTLGVARRTTDIACRSELGRYPIIINIICNTYSYLAPHRGRARYCNAHVCLFLCLCVCLFVRVFAKFQSVISQPFLNRSLWNLAYILRMGTPWLTNIFRIFCQRSRS